MLFSSFSFAINAMIVKWKTAKILCIHFIIFINYSFFNCDRLLKQKMLTEVLFSQYFPVRHSILMETLSFFRKRSLYSFKCHSKLSFKYILSIDLEIFYQLCNQLSLKLKNLLQRLAI